MTLRIDFSPTEEAQLAAAAQREGIEPAALVKKLALDHLPAPAGEPQDPTLVLFDQWAAEDASKSSEERAQEDQMWEAFEQETNEVRRAQGMREL